MASLSICPTRMVFCMDLSKELIFELLFSACPLDLRFHILNSGRFDVLMPVEFFYSSISTLNPYPNSVLLPALTVCHLVQISKASREGQI